MEDNLLMAVLAMNAYNLDSDKVGLGKPIGNAVRVTVGADGQQLANVDSAFAAYAYSYNGQTVISFRGTDDASDSAVKTRARNWMDEIRMTIQNP